MHNVVEAQQLQTKKAPTTLLNAMGLTTNSLTSKKGEVVMADLLKKSGTVNITDLKDSWELVLEAGKKYKYEAENTGDHGKFRFVIKNEVLNYGEVPDSEDWTNLAKVTVDPGKTKTGTFTAGRSVYGLNAKDPDQQERMEKLSYIRVVVKWILTVYKTSYKIRIYE
ncbi:MAG: hypothetical protein HY276_05030 [Ignavibacteriales bacterium]|nr:hypothetical protein [Ignavibacteriales bacterium]MBI3787605.1 hypothetical protein [Ignavibacteriales bacterium]